MLIIGILLIVVMLVIDFIYAADEETEPARITARFVVTAVAVLLMVGSILAAVLIGAAWSFIGGVIFRVIGEGRDVGKRNSSDTTGSPTPVASVKASSDKPTSANPASTPAASSDSGTFTFEASLLSGADAEYTKAHSSDGVVYYDYSFVGTHPIGYYEVSPDDPNKVLILDPSDRGEVGFFTLDSNYVWLSRMAIYNRFKKFEESESWKEANMKAKYPIPPSDIIAEVIDWGSRGILEDCKTGEKIGSFTGSKIGAAAAFVALTSEVHIYTKYHDFLSDWDKSELKS